MQKNPERSKYAFFTKPYIEIPNVIIVRKEIGCLGVWGALDLAVRYSNKRRAFGKEIRNYQAVNFKIADSITQLDAARSLCYMAARAVDENYSGVRRLVSEAKKFATEKAWDIVNNAMQVMGGLDIPMSIPLKEY